VFRLQWLLQGSRRVWFLYFFAHGVPPFLFLKRCRGVSNWSEQESLGAIVLDVSCTIWTIERRMASCLQDKCETCLLCVFIWGVIHSSTSWCEKPAGSPYAIYRMSVRIGYRSPSRLSVTTVATKLKAQSSKASDLATTIPKAKQQEIDRVKAADWVWLQA